MLSDAADTTRWLCVRLRTGPATGSRRRGPKLMVILSLILIVGRARRPRRLGAAGLSHARCGYCRLPQADCPRARMEGGQQKSPWRFDKVSLNLSAFPPSTHTERIPTPPDSFLVLHTDFFWLRPSPTALGAARRGLSAARASLSTSSHGAGPPRQQFDFKFVCMRDT